MIRYVMGYGISGPPIERVVCRMRCWGRIWTCPISSLAGRPRSPTLQGLERLWRQCRRSTGCGARSGCCGRPNSTRCNLIHGLTTTSPDPFPLDPTDVPALQQENDVFDSHPVGANSIQLVDPRSHPRYRHYHARDRHPPLTRRHAPLRRSHARRSRTRRPFLRPLHPRLQGG